MAGRGAVLPSVEAKGTGGGEGSQNSGQGDGQDGCPEVCDLDVSTGLDVRRETIVLFVATAQDMPTSR